MQLYLSRKRDFRTQIWIKPPYSSTAVSYTHLDVYKRQINSRSPVFKFGILEFAEEDREEIYAELNMPNWKETTLFEKDIDEMLLHPTKESLQRIINVPNVQMIERIRGDVYKRQGIVLVLLAPTGLFATSLCALRRALSMRFCANSKLVFVLLDIRSFPSIRIIQRK